MPRRGHGDGSLIQRHDHDSCPPLVNGERPEHHCRGRWVATVDLGWGYEGGKRKRRRKVMYAKTRTEANRKLQKALREKESGSIVVAAPTVETWMNYWLDVICPERGTKVNTLKGYRSKVRVYIIPHLGRHRLDKLTPEHVRAMYRAMRADCPSPDDHGVCQHSPKHPLSEATLRQTHAILRRALVVAEREGKVGRNVAALIDPPSTVRNKRIGLTLEQARKVLAVGTLRAWVALHLGMRQGEALGLRWSDVDLERGWLYVQRALVRAEDGAFFFDTPKSHAGVRDFPLPPKVLAQFKLARALDPSADLVFHHDGAPVDHRADWQEWTDLLASAGVPHVALHAARNTTASLLEAAGVPDRIVAQILGQSTIAVTHGYQHAEASVLVDAMTRLDDLLALPGAPGTT